MTIKLLIDTDPGMGTKDSDPEDSFAIAFALNSPEIEVVGITCVAGNVPVANGYANTLHLLKLLGREDIPVASGAPAPLEPGKRAIQVGRLDSWADHEVLVDPVDVPTSELDAVELIARCSQEADGELVIAAIGPLTNVALALRAHPGLRDQIKELRVMGGAFEIGGNCGPHAEFNLWSDPEAADEVARSGIPIMYVGLDVCHQTSLTSAKLTSGTISTELGRFVVESCESWFRLLEEQGMRLFDTLTIASLVEPSLLTTVARWVSIEVGEGPAQGASGAWTARGPYNELWVKAGDADRVAQDLDVDRFNELFAERVLSLL